VISNVPDAQAEPGAALASWLGLAVAPPVALLPVALRRDLARAALADGQAALALALAADDPTREAGHLTVSALLALGRPADALAELESRLVQSTSIEAARLQAEALLACGERERALAIVRDRVEQQPDAVTAWGAAGSVALAAGALDEAATAFEQARALSPQSTTSTIGLARVWLAAGDAAGAVALLEPLAEGGATTVLAALAEALVAAGRAERAAAVQAELAQRRAALRAASRDRVAATVAALDPVADGLDAASLPSARPVAETSAVPGDQAVPLTSGSDPGRASEAPAVPARGQPVAEPASAVVAASEEAPPSPALARALAEYFGFDAFRPGQAAVCQAVLDGRDTLAVMPTSAGKSLCFQLPAMLLDGVTVVVSPLIALMKDQFDNLPPPIYERATILNSALDAAEVHERTEALGAGRYRLLYVAPERLAQPTLVAALRRAGVVRMVIDEAHCVSAWGHDFRPDYLTIGAALQRLGGPPLLAVTATAPPAVRADIGRALGRTLDVIQTPLFRPNLRYEVQHQPNVDAKMRALVALCRAERGSVVVYVNSRQRTEELAALLRRNGVQAAHYHAGLPPDQRAAVQDAFMVDRTRVIVATVAFGMGVDKANIRLVVHFSLPESLEAYVQESGRAGRDGRPARCVLLYASSDKANLTRWLTRERLSLEDLRAVYKGVRVQLGGADVGLVDERGLGDGLDDEGAETRGRVALSLLDRAGLLERLGMVPGEVVVEPLLPATAADDPRLERLLRGGRKSYDGLALAALLDLPPGEVEPWLLDAREAGRLRYRPLGRALAVRLHPVPADTAARLERLLAEYAAHQDRRVADIVAYAERGTCRHARIYQHFGQRLDPPCGACDVCAPTADATDSPPRGAGAAGSRTPGANAAGSHPHAGATATAAPAPAEPAGPSLPPAAAILGCLADAPFPLTKTGLTRVLLGSMAAPLRPDRTRYHGALRGLGASVVEKALERLLAEDYVARERATTRDGRELSVLVPTARGRQGLPPWDAPVVPSHGRQPAPWVPPRGSAVYDADRFERLRAWRRQQAAEAGIAPFMVFSDATLRALAAVPPAGLDHATLALVPGIGPAKLAAYGDALLALLRQAE